MILIDLNDALSGRKLKTCKNMIFFGTFSSPEHQVLNCTFVSTFVRACMCQFVRQPKAFRLKSLDKN